MCAISATAVQYATGYTRRFCGKVWKSMVTFMKLPVRNVSGCTLLLDEKLACNKHLDIAR